MTAERKAANRDARWAALVIVLALLGGLALLAALDALSQVPDPTPTPTILHEISQPDPGWVMWLDRQLVPGIRFFGRNPVLFAIALLIVAYFLYLCLAVPVVWAIKSRYNGDRTKCSFRVLLLWNILEFTALSPWIMLGRTARHYWPVSFKPWESDTADGKTREGGG